jgi:hypothetical protein
MDIAPNGGPASGVGFCCILLACAATVACGPDTLTASATSAKAAADAAKQAKEQREQIESQLRTMQQTEQKRVDSVGEQADKAAQ